MVREPLTAPPSPCPQLLEDLEEQLNCSAFEEAALTRRICSELKSSLVLAWVVAWPGLRPGGSLCVLTLRPHLLLVAFGHGAAAQTGPGSAGTEGPPGYVDWEFSQGEGPCPSYLLTASHPCRKAAEGVGLAAEPGLPPGHAVPAAADGG